MSRSGAAVLAAKLEVVAFLKYSLIRLALFAPLFALFLYLQLGWLLAAICAPG